MEEKPSLLGVAEALGSHARPGVMAFTFYELMKDAGYTDEEVREVATALNAIVPVQQ